MKLKVPTLDLEKVATEQPKTRLEQLAKTDRKKLEALKKRKEDLELASCTFMPNHDKSARNQQVGVTREFVQKMSKPRTIEKYSKMKEDKEL